MENPKVSLVVINYNYGRYITQAIESIKNQDFEEYECYIIDNNSSDISKDIIASARQRDSRFKPVLNDSNLNQMGALLSVIDELKGDFVSIIDADDFILSNYCSHHLSVLLELSPSVAFSSGAAIEVDDEGRPISQGFTPFLQHDVGEAISLAKSKRTDALIGLDEYQRLAQQTRHIPPSARGWHWSPGTSNMYRRSLLQRARPAYRGGPYVASTDNYFAPLLHALGGSACIDIPLSAYRIHGANRHAAMPTFQGLKTSTVSGANRSRIRRRDITLTLASRADEFVETHRQSFWSLMDAPACADGLSRRAYYTSPEVQQILATHFDKLTAACGAPETERELKERMGSSAYNAFIERLPTTRSGLVSQLRRILRRNST